jgi:hypothetical protein
MFLGVLVKLVKCSIVGCAAGEAAGEADEECIRVIDS